MAKVKNRIKELRKKANLTQKELAKNVGLSNQAISLYESGKRKPKIETWQKLASFFKVSIPYLQGIEDEFSEHLMLRYNSKIEASIYNLKKNLSDTSNLKNINLAFDNCIKSLRHIQSQIQKDISSGSIIKQIQYEEPFELQPVKYAIQAHELYDKDKQFRNYADKSKYLVPVKIYAEYLKKQGKEISDLNKYLKKYPILNRKK